MSEMTAAISHGAFVTFSTRLTCVVDFIILLKVRNQGTRRAVTQSHGEERKPSRQNPPHV